MGGLALPFAEILPHSTGPYVAMMIAGFVIAVFGHMSRSKWLVTIGVTPEPARSSSR